MYEKTLVPLDGSELTEENPESDIIPPLKFILYWKELLLDISHPLVLE